MTTSKRRPFPGKADEDMHPAPGSRREQSVKAADDRHPYGAVKPTDKRDEHYERQERTPKPPVEAPARGPATRSRTRRTP